MRAIGGRSITELPIARLGTKQSFDFERFTIYNCFQKFNCEPIDKTKQHNVCEKETDLTNILVVLIAVGIKTLLDCSSPIVPLGLLIVVKVVMVMMVIAQHMNCAGANLALPRKCTIASDQYIL